MYILLEQKRGFNYYMYDKLRSISTRSPNNLATETPVFFAYSALRCPDNWAYCSKISRSRTPLAGFDNRPSYVDSLAQSRTGIIYLCDRGFSAAGCSSLLINCPCKALSRRYTRSLIAEINP